MVLCYFCSMSSKTKLSILVSALMLFFSSCIVNRDFMLQTDEDYPFAVPKLDTVAREQKINTSSVIELMLLTRNGDMIFESVVSTDGGQTQSARLSRTMSQIEYVQDINGLYNLPLLGKTNLNGMTLFEAQEYLEKKFAQFFVEPYCVLRIVNNRFIYFGGGGSLSQVVNLPNYRVSLLEAITIAGGINSRGISAKIKVIRSVKGKNEVYLFDMSKIDALAYSEFYIQNGDIVYVEPRPLYASGFLGVISPVIALATTVLLYLSILAK
jgi:polysaccharide export outer membrane protein